MNKFLIFDVDNSLSTIGGRDGAKAICGGVDPIRITMGIREIYGYLQKMYTKVETKTKHPIFNEEIVEVSYQPNELAKKFGVTGFVVDTISHALSQDLRILENANNAKTMEMKDWGTLERWYFAFFEFMKQCQAITIVNCHIKYDKDEGTGTFRNYPQLKGSAKDKIEQYFDAVLYTKVAKDATRVQSWQTTPDQSRYAKDRTNQLKPIMPQDHSVVINAYQKAGFPYPKILVVGESGTGKTRALSTLASLTQGQGNESTSKS